MFAEGGGGAADQLGGTAVCIRECASRRRVNRACMQLQAAHNCPCNPQAHPWPSPGSTMLLHDLHVPVGLGGCCMHIRMQERWNQGKTAARVGVREHRVHVLPVPMGRPASKHQAALLPPAGLEHHSAGLGLLSLWQQGQQAGAGG